MMSAHWPANRYHLDIGTDGLETGGGDEAEGRTEARRRRGGENHRDTVTSHQSLGPDSDRDEKDKIRLNQIRLG